MRIGSSSTIIWYRRLTNSSLIGQRATQLHPCTAYRWQFSLLAIRWTFWSAQDGTSTRRLYVLGPPAFPVLSCIKRLWPSPVTWWTCDGPRIESKVSRHCISDPCHKYGKVMESLWTGPSDYVAKRWKYYESSSRHLPKTKDDNHKICQLLYERGVKKNMARAPSLRFSFLQCSPSNSHRYYNAFNLNSCR